MHLDEERLQRLLHGELTAAEEKFAREHVAGCDDCRRRSTAMEQEEETVGALLRRLDRPAPRLDAGAIARRAEARRPHPARWAAGLALVLGLAGVAYAVPGSPLPRWVASVVELVTGHQNPISPAGSAFEPSERTFSGIAVPPGESLLINFEAPNANGRILVSLAPGGDVQVRAPRGAATFTAGEGRLVVVDQGLGATYEVQIPLAAPRVEIRVGETRIFLKDGPRVITAATAGNSFPYLLPLNPPDP